MEANSSVQGRYETHGRPKIRQVSLVLELQPTGRIGGANISDDTMDERKRAHWSLAAAKTWLFPSSEESEKSS